ncbi:MAG: InlB B-repeat-containing protein [Lachnospiraceae bacterium]|nr:InlB B-repeat-containing protein [Lachnospiraceae bacterium]
MKKRLLAIVIALTVVVTDAMAFPSVSSAAENEPSAAEVTAESDRYEGIAAGEEGTSAGEEEIAPAGEQIEEDNAPAGDRINEDAGLTEEDTLTGYPEDEAELDVDFGQIPDDEGTVHGKGFVLPPNYKDPEEVGSDDDHLMALERSYINPYISDSLKLRDQGNFGTCWAFASIGLAEFSLMSQGLLSEADLSEIHLAYFTSNSEADPLGGTTGDQSTSSRQAGLLDYGGNFQIAGNTLASWIGAADESTAPYSKAGSVNKGGSLDPAIAFTDKAHLKDIYRVSLSRDPGLVKELIKEYGAAGVSFFAADGLSPRTDQNVYNKNTNSYYNPVNTQANHSVMIVGWDDDYPASNFVQDPGGDGAWLVRNSWLPNPLTYGNASSHQYSGYFWMSYHEQTLLDEATFFVFDKSDNFDNNYQYDGAPFDFFRIIDKAASIFTADSDNGNGEILKAVSVNLYSPNVKYTIEIYKNTDPSDPESGTKVCTQSGRTTYEGMYTISLNNPVTLGKGERFSVVISFEGGAQLACESGADMGFANYNCTAEKGQTFFYTYEWMDCDPFDSNVRIKAFTDDIEGAQIDPESIEFDGDLDEKGLVINKDDTYKVGYKLIPADATNRGLKWKSSDESVAVVDGKGVITAIETGTATITATAMHGGASNSFTVTVTALLKGIKINAREDKAWYCGKSYPMSVRPVPEGSELSGDIVWSSNNNRIAYVDDGKLVVCGTGWVEIKAALKGTDISDRVNLFCDLTKPVLKLNRNGNKVTIEFDAVDGAQKYAVTRLIPVFVTEYDYTYKKYEATALPDIAQSAGKRSYSFDDDISRFLDKAYVMYEVAACGDDSVREESYASVYLNIKTHKITYNAGIGLVPPNNPDVYAEDGDYFPLDPPIAPEGYDAVGWRDNQTKIMVDFLPFLDMNYNLIYKDYSVTAVYAPHKYSVSYIANGGTGTMDATAAEYGKAFKLAANKYSRTGFKFVGWNTKPDGSGTSYMDRESVINLTAEDGVTIRLYAQWGGEPFDVTLDANGGTIRYGSRTVSEVKIKVDAKSNYPELPSPERAGFSFDGWFTEKFGGERILPGDSVREVKVLYAHWSGKESRVTFDGNGADLHFAPVYVKLGEQYGNRLPKVEITLDNASFCGWFMERECVNLVTAETVVTETEDHTLYAGWKTKAKAEAPQFFILGKPDSDGLYEEGTRIEIRCATPGALIYYTIREGDPDTLYTEPVRAFFEGKTDTYLFNIKAKAVKMAGDGAEDYTESAVMTLAEAINIRPSAKDNGDIAASDLPAYEAMGRPDHKLWAAGIDAAGYEYNGTQIKPQVRVYFGKSLLREGRDYKLSYQNNTNAYRLSPGDDGFNEKTAPAVKIAFAGDYSGNLPVYFRINPLSIADGSVLLPETVTVRHNGNRQEKTADITFTNGAGKSVKLKNKTDFTCDFNDGNYTDRNEEGYTVTVAGVNNFNGTASYKEIITGKTLISKMSIKGIENKEFSGGNVIQDKLSVYDKQALLEEGKDYSVKYYNNTNIGTATICISGMGDYSGEVYKTFRITGRPMGKVTVPADMGGANNTRYGACYDAGTKKFEFTGSPINIAGDPGETDDLGVKLTYNGETLVLGTDYDVSYEKNTEAGNASVIFTGKGKYAGSLRKTFGILQYVHNDRDPGSRVSITVPGIVPYEKGGACPKIAVKFTAKTGDETTLAEGVHYTVKYSDNAVNGKKPPKAVITFKGSFKGKAERTFAVTKKNIGEATLSAADRQADGKPGSFGTSFAIIDTNGVKLSAGSDYSKDVSVTYGADTLLSDGSLRKKGVQVRKNDILKPGTVLAVTAKGSGNYEGEVSGLYRVYGYDISKAKVTVTPQNYTGRPVCPGKADIRVTLKTDGAEKELGAGDFYIARYENNSKKGSGKVIIKGIGVYGGSAAGTFAITAAR